MQCNVTSLVTLQQQVRKAKGVVINQGTVLNCQNKIHAN